ncbi:MAG: peptidoglycan DD-metalloendopeptidase family protein [Lewinellaceae bacterium]|nr:peptidoglycan DD-metalloendopeptidase family protein [Lewinellaceae bacterium]
MIRTLLLCSTLFLSATIIAQVNCDTILSPPSGSEYVLPYPPGKSYRIIQGNCPAIGGHANTFAYDFDTQTGDTIVACRQGVVIWVNEQYADTDWVSGHENNVFVRHNDGTVIRYTHLKQNGALVNANSVISQGQPIGLSGSSGNTGGVPHLHLQAFRDGTSYDKWNAIPLNFSNTDGPVNGQNLLVNGQSYTALGDSPVDVHGSAALEPAVVVFPNPAEGEIHLRSTRPIREIRIVDSLGRLAFQQETEGAGRREVDVDMSGKTGLFFLAVNMEGRQVVQKVLVR